MQFAHQPRSVSCRSIQCTVVGPDPKPPALLYSRRPSSAMFESLDSGAEPRVQDACAPTSRPAGVCLGKGGLGSCSGRCKSTSGRNSVQGLRSRCGIEGHVDKMAPLRRPCAVGVRGRICLEAAVAGLQVRSFQVLSSAFVRGGKKNGKCRVARCFGGNKRPHWQSTGGGWRS